MAQNKISTFSKALILPSQVITPTPDVAWDPGVYFKVGGAKTFDTGTSWFPPVYDPGSHQNSCYGILDNKLWCKGFQLEAPWGKIDNGNPNPALWDWGWLDDRFTTVEGLGKPTGQNKKILLLLTSKAFVINGVSDVDSILPADLLAFTGTPYAAQPPRIPTPPTRYHYLWAFLNGSAGFEATHGYHYNFHNLIGNATDGFLSGNDAAGNLIYTFRDRYYKFLDALIDRYKDNPVFAGFVTTETSPMSPLDSTAFVSAGTYKGLPYKNSVTAYQDGRVAHLQHIKTKLLKHPIAEAANFNNAYATRMTSGINNGCVANRVAYSNPNCHTGTNQTALPNLNTYIRGKVPIFFQIQPLEMDGRAGAGSIGKYWDWRPTPPTYGSPNVQITKPAGYNVKASYVPPANEKPIDGNWAIERCKYYGVQYLIYQRDTNTANGQYDLGDPRFNWNDFSDYMDANYAVDPLGGMSDVKPEFIV